LLSSLPVLPSTAADHVEKSHGRVPSGPGGSSIGTLHGTATFSYESLIAGSSEVVGYYIDRQSAQFTTGTGSVKPFGRVRIDTDGSYSEGAGSAVSLRDTPTADDSPLPSSLEGPVNGVIDLATSRGRVVGSITVQGDTWGQFVFQEGKNNGRLIASATLRR
jgi:hypothetical protein